MPTPTGTYDLVVVGGGAAGFFTAVTAAEHATAPLRIAILEQGRKTLQKVRISGGGRCNVTHAEFDPRALTEHYPRGQRELRGPFTRFAPGDTMDWFERRGVPLKIEDDGRVFPTSDDSESIAGTLERTAAQAGIEVRTSCKVTGLVRSGDSWELSLNSSHCLSAKQVMLATGSAGSVLTWLAKLGIALVDPVPSLFTFKVDEPKLHALAGLSVGEAQVTLEAPAVATRGPLLITHWGMSGPAVLRASAEAAVGLHAQRYRTGFRVSWTHSTKDEASDYVELCRRDAGGKSVGFNAGLPLPKRLWRYLLDRSRVPADTTWASLTKTQIRTLAETLAADRYTMTGQSRFKAEFVTAGGIDLRELDTRRFAIKRHAGLYAAGEVLNIDGVTGGFNFQAAWTGGYLAGVAIAEAATNKSS